MQYVENLYKTHNVYDSPSGLVRSFSPKRTILHPVKPYVPCPKVKFARLIGKLIRSRPDDPDYIPPPPPVGFKGICPAPKLFEEKFTRQGVRYLEKC